MMRTNVVQLWRDFQSSPENIIRPWSSGTSLRRHSEWTWKFWRRYDFCHCHTTSLSTSSSHSRFYFSLFIFNSTIYDCRVSRKRVQFSRRRDDVELIKIVDFFSYISHSLALNAAMVVPGSLLIFLILYQHDVVVVMCMCRLFVDFCTFCLNHKHNIVVFVLKVAKQQPQQQNVNREIKTKRVLAILRWNYIESS